MKESLLLKQIMIEFSKLGARLFRNNVGSAWMGKIFRPPHTMTVAVTNKDIIIYSARPVHFGLAVGSSDLIGWAPVKITEQHVGKTFAIFTAIETKSDRGKITNAQEAFTNAVKASGGIASIVKSVDQATEVLNGF
jgi:VRR-NUC domain